MKALFGSTVTLILACFLAGSIVTILEYGLWYCFVAFVAFWFACVCAKALFS